MRFRDIPQLISDGNYQVDVQMEYLIKWIDEMVRDDGLQLCPDFQRGHVWTEEQQIKYIEFVLRGGKTGKILYFNNPSWHRSRPTNEYNDFVCVDGLQRITAIRRFLNDEIRVFGHLYSEFEGDTDIVRHSVAVNINDLKTKEEVLQWYLEMNAGGTPHSKAEIERVTKLLEECRRHGAAAPVSEDQMLADTDQVLDAFQEDYRRMAE